MLGDSWHIANNYQWLIVRPVSSSAAGFDLTVHGTHGNAMFLDGHVQAIHSIGELYDIWCVEYTAANKSKPGTFYATKNHALITK